MTFQKYNTQNILALMGLIPFMFSMFCLTLGCMELPIIGDVSRILSVYTIVICSFMAGTHWGLQLHDKISSSFLAISSNIVAVVLWLSFIFLSTRYFLITAAMMFVVMLVLEKKSTYEKVIVKSYWTLRFWVTSVAVSSLLISAVFV